MKSSTVRGPLQAGIVSGHSFFSFSCRSFSLVSILSVTDGEAESQAETQLTGPDIGHVAEERAKVHPLRGIAVDGPAAADLLHGEAVEELRGRAVDVRVLARVRFQRRRHGCWFIEWRMNR